MTPDKKCQAHIPVQHRDGKEPWCPNCGLNRDFVAPRSMFHTLKDVVKPPSFDPPTMDQPSLSGSEFEEDLRKLINKHSLENRSGTPDFILADHLVSCLMQFEVATNRRRAWRSE